MEKKQEENPSQKKELNKKEEEIPEAQPENKQQPGFFRKYIW